jgi:hypothetical protein
MFFRAGLDGWNRVDWVEEISSSAQQRITFKESRAAISIL